MNDSLTYNQSEIRFGSLSATGFNALLKSDRYAQAKKIILTDETVFALWMEHFISHHDALHEAEIIQLPPGEENKVLAICEHVWHALSEYEIGRNDLIINLGGGVITDMGGFIAATFKRGMSFINIPTTLLSQVDASVGGKTGIDLGPFKNQIGVFADPDFVFVDTDFLTTLDATELLSGYAEMLKHGLIADSEYWSQLQKIDPRELPQKLLEHIQYSVQLKRDIVAADHQEKGQRKLLNFGHTIGHALEGYLLQKGTPIPHGNGVAWGMIAEACLSMENGLLSAEDFEQIVLSIREKYPKPGISPTAIPELMALMRNDKKNEAGIIQFTLLNKPGKAIYNQQVSMRQIEAALAYILNN